MHLNSENVNYPDTIQNVYDQVRDFYAELDKAYTYLGTFNYEKIMDDISAR